MEKEHHCRDHPPGSFEALKEAELITSCLAQAMAPTRIRQPGETRRSFGFEGHRVIFRELTFSKKQNR